MLIDSFGFSQSLVDEICDFLDLRSDSLTSSRPEGVGASFGSSPSSVACAADAGLAKDHVAKAITDMAAGLQAFRTNFVDLRNRTEHVEDVTTAELNTQFARAEACQAPTFASPTQCTVPGSSSEAG